MPIAASVASAKPSIRPRGSETETHRAHVDFNRITDEQFQIAADHMRLVPEIQLLLRTPYRELIVQVPLRRDDGRLEMFHGYRVQHNAVRGPYKGGIRIIKGLI